MSGGNVNNKTQRHLAFRSCVSIAQVLITGLQITKAPPPVTTAIKGITCPSAK